MGTKADQRFEKRKMVIDAIQRGERPSVVASVMGVPMRTVFDWLARYRSGGVGGLKDGARSGRPGKVNHVVIAWLYDAITLGNPMQFQMPFCLWTLNIVRGMLKKFHGIELSRSSVSRLLSQLGLSPQRPIYKSYKKDPRELERYLTRTFPELKAQAARTGAEIYFVDESAVRSDSHHGTTWAPIGRTPEVEDSGDRFGMKLISAVSPRGDLRFGTIEGSMNSDKFIRFLEKLHRDAGRPIIIIADNAPYHTSGKVRKFAAQSSGKITLGHLPRYAPELNPDEQVWNHAKSRLGKLFFTTRKEMRRLMFNILRSIQKSKRLVRSFFGLNSTKYAAA